MTDLAAHVAAGLGRPVRPEVRAAAAALAAVSGAEGGAENKAAAVLFYGSNLRTGSLDGLLDFYVLMPGPPQGRIWPRVGYREWPGDGPDGVVRAKVAWLTLGQFAAAAAGRGLDTTVWTRFVQPAALVFASNDAAAKEVVAAVAGAARTAARFAAALGPAEGTAAEFWQALFAATYRAEFRIEPPGREAQIIAGAPRHFAALLPLAWDAAGIAWRMHGEALVPRLDPAERARLRARWRRLARAGRPLNILRLAKAATTFEGAARYAAWKLERHTGIALAVTPFRERHPLLAMPGAALELWRARRRARAQR